MAGVVGTTAPRIQIFRPTMEEFRDFPGYINYMESRGAHKAGLAKVIPPKEWVPRKNGYDDIEHLIIPSPISQMVTGRQGLYQQFNIQKRSMTVKEFHKLADSDNFRTPDHFDYEDLERKYWKNVTYNSPIYGADVSGSLYDPGIKEWNINHLNTILDCVSGDYGIKIDGVNTAYLYFGMWKTSFAWHTEDMDLYSINYLHFGSPKSWYVIPPEHGKRLERLANGFFPSSCKSCPAFLRHKMTIISPPILKKYSIPIDKITQEPGEFMVTFPYGYHAGYNHGFNCAESTNFATERWIEYGKRASQCTCRKDSVKISMDTFVKRFQPDRYELWHNGKDIGPHPEDPSRCTAAPPPSKCELVLNNRQKVPVTEKRRKSMNCVSKRLPISAPGQVKRAKKGKHMSESNELETDDSCHSSLNKDEDQQQPQPRVRGLKCHVVISKSNDETNEYRATLGGLVKFDDYDETILAATTIDVTHRQPIITTLPETVRKLEEHVTKRLPPTIINLTEQQKNNLPSMPVYSGRAYKSILLPRNNAIIVSKPPDVVVSPTTLTPPMSGDDDPSSVSPVQQKVAYDYSCSFIGRTTAELNSSTCSLRDSLGALEHTNNVFTPKSTEQIASVQLKDECVVACDTSEDQVLKTVQTYASHDETNNAVVFDSSESNNSDKSTFLYGNRDDELGVCTTTDLPVYLPSELSPPMLSPASPEDSLVAFTIATTIKEADVLMPTLPREPRCVTPAFIYQSVDDSDDDENDAIKDAWSSNENSDEWAKPLNKLWQHKLTNFDAEMAFNEFCAETEPHCSICSLFAPLQFKGLELDLEGHAQKTSNIPSYSRVLMPEAVFLSASREESAVRLETMNSDEATVTAAMGSLSPISSSMSSVDANGYSRLLVCEDCKVCVHASCYGVLNYDSSVGTRWRCSRCIRQNINAECCLCVLRGGALKPTTDGRWAHVVCTLVVHDVFFETVPSREPVNISRITLARLELNCVFCRQLVRRCGRFSGACIQCTAAGENKCAAAFHVTCGIAAGVKFEACDWPELIQVSCPKHSDEKKREDLHLPELSVGQAVIAKHKNNRYYHCVVSERVTKIFYCVDFDATTSCDNLYPMDVESRDCLRDGPPPVDEQVTVRWTDNKLYEAIFRGTNTVIKYEVTFEDGSRRIMESEHIYSADEELPKRVKSRLSTATESKHPDAFPVVETPVFIRDGGKKAPRRII